MSNPKKGKEIKETVKLTRQSTSRTNSIIEQEETDDIWKCQICDKCFDKPDAKLLECQRCTKHYCIKCLKKTDTEYQILCCSDSMWFCGQCKSKIEENIATERMIEEKCRTIVAEFEKRIDSIETELKQKCTQEEVRSIIQEEHNPMVLERIAEMEKNISSFKDEVMQSQLTKPKSVPIKQFVPTKQYPKPVPLRQPITPVVADDDFWENEDRERRKLNLILYNVPESTAEEVDERRGYDEAEVCEILHQLGLHDMVNITHLYRLGKKEQKPRLLLVKVPDLNSKFLVLQRARYLKTCERWKDIYIRPDFTLKERERRRELLQELKRRQEDGETDLMIYRGAIIKSVSKNNPFFRR